MILTMSRAFRTLIVAALFAAASTAYAGANCGNTACPPPSCNKNRCEEPKPPLYPEPTVVVPMPKNPIPVWACKIGWMPACRIVGRWP